VNTILELAAAALLIFGGAWLYWRRGSEGASHYGSQGAVLLMFLGAIVAVHGLGLLDYRPSATEIQR